MSKFDYLTPKTIEEAISMFVEKSNENPIYMAGGTDILLRIKKGEISPTQIISLRHINNHGKVQLDPDNGNLIIGSFVTHSTLENSTLINKNYKIIHDAVKRIGSTQIRNIATIGGNLVNAVPSADGAIPLMALDGFVRLVGKNGERTVKLASFFIGPRQTVLKPSEILVDIIIPNQKPVLIGAYKKFTRRAAMELPIIGIAVALSMEKNSRFCRKARICLGVAAPIPMRAINAENYLKNKFITKKMLIEAGNIAAEESKVRDSIRGKAWHRKKLISVFVRRMGMLTIKRIESINF